METTFLESLSADQALTAIYIGYYNRAPDPEGFAFWQGITAAGFDRNNDGSNLDDLADVFASAEETLTVHPFFSNPTDASASAFVTELYANLFNRAPDADGLAFWTAQLQSAIAGEGTMSVGDIILAIIGGAQTAADGGFPDQETIGNKIDVGLAWQTAAADNNIAFEGDAVASAAAIITGVDSTSATVDAATADIATFVAANQPVVTPPSATTTILSSDAARDNLTGGDGVDIFEAYNGELQDGDRMDGGAGNDTLTYFSSVDGPAISAITTSVENVVATIQTNDQSGQADNNVGGYTNLLGDGTVEVDVELDAGQMVGVERWENYDSRADLVIEDARDDNDVDGTFTADIVVAMVSTDPGNVDYAVYFDGPVNQPGVDTSTVTLQILDNDGTETTSAAAITGDTPGVLTDAAVSEFVVNYNGALVTVELFDQDAVNAGTISAPADIVGAAATYNTLAAAIQTAINANETLAGEGLTVSLGSTFAESAGAINPVGLGTTIFGLNIVIEAQPGNELEAVSRLLFSDDPSRSITARLDDAVAEGADDLISLQVQLDDVGKGSMGGDALFGAMSTGRQSGDDGTSDSIGIQQFDITVDRSSQLQTINSTNNSLEVVNIDNGANTGMNATNTADDEERGDLVVRGQANADADIDTDSPMPGAVTEHNAYGFSDVRVIDASGMVGSVDITANLTEEVVEKYLDIQDTTPNGETDDVTFDYTLGSNSDEFFLNLSSDAVNSAGTGSREDFNLDIDGGTGSDVITTNVGMSTKQIDEQGQDHYDMTSVNLGGNASWYTNAVSNVAADFAVSGGTGNDTIWTHGWGDFDISDGAGLDNVYTDNSGAVQASTNIAANIDRTLDDEPDQIDYVTGAAWAFNAENVTAFPFGATGATNETIVLATLPAGALRSATTGDLDINVSFFGAGGAAGTAYTARAEIALSQLTINSVTGVVSITEQTLNQAIKEAVNENRILSNVLEAADAPGNALIVASKIDGAFSPTDFTVSLGALTLNNTTVGVTGTLNTGYTAPEFAQLGAASTAESDNTIDVAGDGNSDLFVLSTNDVAEGQPTVDLTLDAATDLNGASNEILEFNAGFGVDTVFNFDAGDGNGTVDGGEDVLDFSNITNGTNTLRAFTSAGDDVVITTVVTVDGVDAGSTIEAAEVIAFFGAGDTTASEHIVIIHDTTGDNGGEVWHITDGVAATNDVTAVEVGTINLVGTDWTLITADNIA